MHTRFTPMQPGFHEDESARAAIERRWFALHGAAGRLQQECLSLAEAMQATQDAWREARARLSELEALRDALGEELSRQDMDVRAHVDWSEGGKSANVSRMRRAKSR